MVARNGGNRIPPSPPDSLDCREFPLHFQAKLANYARFSRFLPDKSDSGELASQGNGGYSYGLFLRINGDESELEEAVGRKLGDQKSNRSRTRLDFLLANSCRRVLKSMSVIAWLRQSL